MSNNNHSVASLAYRLAPRARAARAAMASSRPGKAGAKAGSKAGNKAGNKAGDKAGTKDGAAAGRSLAAEPHLHRLRPEGHHLWLSSSIPLSR